MGRPKQLLPYNGKSLLEHTVDTANDADANPVIVVLGANAALLEKEIDEKKVRIVENKEWKEGMASSVRCGLTTLTAYRSFFRCSDNNGLRPAFCFLLFIE